MLKNTVQIAIHFLGVPTEISKSLEHVLGIVASRNPISTARFLGSARRGMRNQPKNPDTTESTFNESGKKELTQAREKLQNIQQNAVTQRLEFLEIQAEAEALVHNTTKAQAIKPIIRREQSKALFAQLRNMFKAKHKGGLSKLLIPTDTPDEWQTIYDQQEIEKNSVTATIRTSVRHKAHHLRYHHYRNFLKGPETLALVINY